MRPLETLPKRIDYTIWVEIGEDATALCIKPPLADDARRTARLVETSIGWGLRTGETALDDSVERVQLEKSYGKPVLVSEAEELADRLAGCLSNGGFPSKRESTKMMLPEKTNA